MTRKARLPGPASYTSENPEEEKKPFGNMEGLDPNPPHGEKGDFVKVTVTLPPAVYELIAQEAMRRKMAKEPNPLISAIIREAIVEKYLPKDHQ